MFAPKNHTPQPITMEEARETVRFSLKKVENGFIKLSRNKASLHDNPAVNFFLNNHVLSLSQDTASQEKLLKAIINKQWNDPVFDSKDLQKLAFTLYSQGKITNPAFETLIRRFYIQPAVSAHEAKCAFPPRIRIHAYPVLDEQGHFTREAQKMILGFTRNFRDEPLQGINRDNWQRLLQASFEIDPSQNIFFQVESDQLWKDELLKQLLPYYAVHTPDYLDNSYLVFSCLMEDALQLCTNKINDMVHARLHAGNLDKFAIEQCDFSQIRPLAVLGFGLPETSNVHDFPPDQLTRFSIMAHDLYHTRNRGAQGELLGRIWSYMKELSRVPLKLCTNLKNHQFPLFCTLTWYLVDAEFKHYPGKTLEENFCINMEDQSPDRIFVFDRENITDFGMQVFMDMVIHEDRWKDKFHFNTENMTEKFKKHYEIARKIKPFLQEDLQYNVILFKAFLTFGEMHFSRAREYIEDSYLCLQDSFEFIRNNSTQFLGLINKKVGKLDEHALAFVILQSFENPENIDKGISKNAYKNFLSEEGMYIKNIALIHLYFGKDPAIKDALSALRMNVLNLLEESLLESVFYPSQQFLRTPRIQATNESQRTIIGEVMKYCLIQEKKIMTSAVTLNQ